jgi:acetoin utilization protein AcuC
LTAGCRTGNGDGVHAAFYDEPRVLTVSIYQSPLSLFPGTGFPTDCGDGPASGTSVNIEVPAGTGDASWLRAFHAVVPGVVRAFRPDVLVTQHGTDTHREDPLSDLNLSIDGQHTSYEALRRLADGRWLALGGGGGTARCGWYPGVDPPARDRVRPRHRPGHPLPKRG